MILQAAIDVLEATMDYFLLIFFFIAAGVFVITTYNKPELRTYLVTLVSLILGSIFCIVGIELVEGAFVLIASIAAVISTIILRIKTKKKGEA